ncbi:SUKH-4 family immunity protein [Streptomyces sp. SR27]|uniref:SUKH-4 family immunity protein n=1 Tax=Streptomyces sp. SR27 TaxID=3076630 RepID=UPI00295BB649|nr:SUKH-4 family immunity protein [Streptomyces sp. SR27]MDV9191542.1 SUKH-4 family immunity protein [Streptomyces sp. SR27]
MTAHEPTLPAPRDDAALFDDPARVLRHDRAELRARLAALPGHHGGVGREVFTQAEAVFGTDPVTTAEFASWLHFAATVLGHREYAEEVAAAEPGLPWRTVWAWWRPVGAYEAEPNLSGDGYAGVYGTDAGPLLKVSALWCEDTWFDLATGVLRDAPDPGAAVPYEGTEPDGPWLFDTDDESWALHVPDAWEEPVPLDGGRYVFQDARGVAVVEQNDKALADWPSGGAGASGPTPPDGGPWFRPGTRNTEAGEPLTAARLDRIFGPSRVVRVPAADLPAALTHEPTRALLAGAGLPRRWAAGVTSFAVDAQPLGPGPEGLLRVGAFDLGYCDPGEVFVDPTTGAVGMRQPDGSHGPGGDAVFPLARDLDAFVRLLEGVRRHMGACWDPYPGEAGVSAFLRAMDAVDAGALAEGAPGAGVWEHLFASVTELGVYGY